MGKLLGFVLPHPVLLFLGVFISLVFFLLRKSLVFLSVFCLVLRVFEGLHGEKIPWSFFEVSLVLRFFRKDQARKRRTGQNTGKNESKNAQKQGLRGIFLFFWQFFLYHPYSFYFGPEARETPLSGRRAGSQA